MEPITSPTNARVKHLVRLRNRRERDRTSTFLIEGYRELRKAAASSIVVREIYYAPDLFLGVNEPALVQDLVTAGATPYELAARAFRKAAYRDRPEGLIAVAEQFDTALTELELGPEPLLLVVESIEKPGNLGTMLRTADAAGTDAVIVCDPATDPFNPNTVRASIGSLFTVPVAVGAAAETLDWLREHGIRTVVTAPHADLLHWEASYRGPVAVVVGSEQFGLSDSWFAHADGAVRVPMAGASDSLNAAMAAGIVLFEAVRQREAQPAG